MKKKKLVQLLTTAILTAFMIPATLFAEETGASQGASANLEFTDGKTVYYNGNYYATLTEALKGVYMSKPQGVAELYCKQGADVGAMTHGHVADDIIIHGNGAYVSSGERDLEVDTYKYDRLNGERNDNEAYLEKDITVDVRDLNGIAAWGERNTKYTVNLKFENCKNMQRVYFTNNGNKDGKINITLNNCSFDNSAEALLKANAGTAVYSNASGNITITNTLFKEISVGLNMNHKSNGEQKITLDGCTFEDCAVSDLEKAEETKTYAAPVRVVAQNGAKTALVLNDVKFVYSEGKKSVGNGDVLIGDGRSTASDVQGIITLSMEGTKAEVMVQEQGYYTDGTGNSVDETKAETTSVEEFDIVEPNEDNHFEIDKHDSFDVVDAKDATCTEEGYTGDKVCTKCGKVVEKGDVIKTLAHNFKDGKCTMCGALDPDFVPEDQKKPDDKTDSSKSDQKDKGTAIAPKTGDNSNIVMWVALMLVSGMGIASVMLRSRKGQSK